ncbi:hypothetical protein QJS04_geneDACA017552 [Acorus gramineus]|uniref:Haloacid dehalogenase-like hydrolase domain-containing protein n=1 Tax=Acorus gramineus TaxID=55184 RepID=A0AAV9BLF2_ACOGR|nr:hypothetical protein QJS04_geneDACA017552 [Acorus gramineus]
MKRKTLFFSYGSRFVLLFLTSLPHRSGPGPRIPYETTPPPPPSSHLSQAPSPLINSPFKLRRFSLSCSSSSDVAGSKLAPPLAVLLEVDGDGVLVDTYRSGTFQKLGLDCANWTEPIYMDLLSKCISCCLYGLNFFCVQIGWPSSLPTNEKEAFIKSVLEKKRIALDEYVLTKSMRLWPLVWVFIDDAINGGVPVVILSAYSKLGDELARSFIHKLGFEQMEKVKIVGKEEVEGSFYGQLVLGEGVSSSLDEQLAKEARRMASTEKQKIAKEVASMLKLSVDIDTTSSESFQKIVAALRAAAEFAGLPVENCVLIAGSQSGVLAAERIGMPCVVLRSSLTARAEFRSANAVMDGFGGADLTIAKLLNKRWS